MVVSGPVTLENVTRVLQDGLVHVRGGVTAVDFAGVSELDSSLLAATLAWIREARLANHSLVVSNLPLGLQTLTQLYGVEELLPVGAPH
jgi:phospholipid transport system transporter-binding protein